MIDYDFGWHASTTYDMYYEGKSVGCHNIIMVLRGKQYIGRDNKEGSSKETRQKDLSRRRERTHGEGGGGWGKQSRNFANNEQTPNRQLACGGVGKRDMRKRGRRTGVGRELKGVCVSPCFSPSNTRTYLSAPDKRGGRKFLESHKGERGTGRRRRSAPSPPTGSPHNNALCRDGG